MQARKSEAGLREARGGQILFTGSNLCLGDFEEIGPQEKSASRSVRASGKGASIDPTRASCWSDFLKSKSGKSVPKEIERPAEGGGMFNEGGDAIDAQGGSN